MQVSLACQRKDLGWTSKLEQAYAIGHVTSKQVSGDGVVHPSLRNGSSPTHCSVTTPAATFSCLLCSSSSSDSSCCSVDLPITDSNPAYFHADTMANNRSCYRQRRRYADQLRLRSRSGRSLARPDFYAPGVTFSASTAATTLKRSCNSTDTASDLAAESRRNDGRPFARVHESTAVLKPSQRSVLPLRLVPEHTRILSTHVALRTESMY